MRGILFLVTSCVFIFSSCNRANQKYDKAYFDFDSLINVQVSELVKVKMMIKKTSIVNGKSDDSSFVPDSLKLANELDIFRQLDLINKPLYRTSYEIKAGEKDTKSNLMISSYISRSPTPVPFVKFYYQPSPKVLKKIEAVFHEENALYDTRRNLIMEFDDSNGLILLRSYQLSGMQKMILSDSVGFSVAVSFLPGKP
jgi:hypothetical protein